MNQKHQQELQQSFNQLTEIAEEVFLGQKASDARHGIDLLEIYAGTQSPLTDAVREMGGTAIRFTRLDGDLSTASGRRKLWQTIDKYQPHNIFVAPECGPWGGWSHLNAQKSVAGFDRIQERRAHRNLFTFACVSSYVPSKFGTVVSSILSSPWDQA